MNFFIAFLLGIFCGYIDGGIGSDMNDSNFYSKTLALPKLLVQYLVQHSAIVSIISLAFSIAALIINICYYELGCGN